MMGNTDHPGIIPQALRQVFDHVASASADRRFLIRCSYVEIYREVCSVSSHGWPATGGRVRVVRASTLITVCVMCDGVCVGTGCS